jgi:hypothetical protein
VISGLDRTQDLPEHSSRECQPHSVVQPAHTWVAGALTCVAGVSAVCAGADVGASAGARAVWVSLHCCVAHFEAVTRASARSGEYLCATA